MKNKSFKVLYLSYDGMTDPLGQSQVLPYLRGLSLDGYQFTLISFEKSGRFEQYQSIIQGICDDAGVKWVPLKYTKRPPVLSTLMDILKMKRTVKRLHESKQFDLVHCRSYISALVGLSMKREYGTKFIFDMRGFWADERVDGGIWNLQNPLYRIIYRFFKRREHCFFSEADSIISLTEAGRQEIHSWNLSEIKLPITVIPCCADLDLFSYKSLKPGHLKAIKKDLALPESSLILSYLGSIGTWYMLPQMLAFFKVVKKHIPDAHFLFITGDDPKQIKTTAVRLGISIADLSIRRANREDVPYYLSLSDIGIFFIKPVYSKKASSPTKQGEIMGMGIPIICNDNVGDTGPIIEATGAGLTLSSFDEAEFEKAVAQMDKLLRIPKEKIRAGAEQYYSLKQGIASYSNTYNSLLS